MTRPPAARVAELTKAALRRIDREGPRGLTMITPQQIEAMALTIVAQAERIGQLEKEMSNAG